MVSSLPQRTSFSIRKSHRNRVQQNLRSPSRFCKAGVLSVCLVFLITIMQAKSTISSSWVMPWPKWISLGSSPELQINLVHAENGFVYIETSHIILKNNLNPETFILQEKSQRHMSLQDREPPQFSAASSEFPDTWLSGCLHLSQAGQSWGILKGLDEIY